LSNLFCGFAAIILADMFWSPLLLLACFVFDSLDGAAARWFNAQSQFGKELDSLADIVSFGVLPAVMYIQLSPLGENNVLSVAVCGLIVVAGAIRLAKFNITESKPYFSGLPVPANALFYAGLVISKQWGDNLYSHFVESPVLYIITSVFISLMMVSFRVRMFTTKGLSKVYKDNIYHYVMLIISVLSVILYRFDALPVIILIYIILSIINTLTAKAEQSIPLN
jgi:CDP-diacylglycerol--serine O-phosphatidyltransferase